MHSVLLPPGGIPSPMAQRHAPTGMRKAMYCTRTRVAKKSPETQQQPQQQPVSISEISTLQELLERAKKPWRNQQQTPQPSTEDGRRPEQIQRRLNWDSLDINVKEPVGKQAFRLTSTLRTRQHTDVRFAGVLSVVKCLKVLAITNQFLLDHGTTSRFVFAKVSPAQHQKRLSNLMQNQLRIQHLSRGKREQRHPYVGSAFNQPAKPLLAETGIQQEPVPRLPALLFNLHVWSLKQDEVEEDEKGRQIQNLEFAIDLRQEWARHAYVSFDTALAMADTLFDQLLSQVEASMISMPHGQAESPRRQQRQIDDRKEFKHVPHVKCACSTPQVLPLFAALSFVQQRLYQDNSPYMLVCSVAPPSQFNRMDGCKGFVISAELQPRSYTKAVLFRRRTYRKSAQRSQSHNAEDIRPSHTASSQDGNVSTNS